MRAAIVKKTSISHSCDQHTAPKFTFVQALTKRVAERLQMQENAVQLLVIRSNKDLSAIEFTN